MEEFPRETAGFEPFEFQLANGNRVRIAFGKFWEEWTDSDRFGLTTPLRFYAIRVYSSQDVLSNRMVKQYEFREDHEFALHAVASIWLWLENLVETRKYADYDWLEDFIEDFAEEIARLSNTEEAVEHIEHLPQLTEPEAFDKVDDSVFNDQNDAAPEN